MGTSSLDGEKIEHAASDSGADLILEIRMESASSETLENVIQEEVDRMFRAG